MTGAFGERRVQRRRRVVAGVAIVTVALFFVVGWMDRSQTSVTEHGTPRRIVVVSDAGPVDISVGAETQIVRRDSWLWSKPLVELSDDADELVVRVTCPGSFPCRSSLDIEVPAATELVLIATGGPVQIDSFEGDLTIFSTGQDINLGPLRGSARIVSDTGDVAAFGLGLGALTVQADRASMDLQFADEPDTVVLTSATGSIRLEVPDSGYRLAVRPDEDLDGRVRTEIEVDERAAATIAIRSEGSVVVVPFDDDD